MESDLSYMRKRSSGSCSPRLTMPPHFVGPASFCMIGVMNVSPPRPLEEPVDVSGPLLPVPGVLPAPFTPPKPFPPALVLGERLFAEPSLPLALHPARAVIASVIVAKLMGDMEHDLPRRKCRESQLARGSFDCESVALRATTCDLVRFWRTIALALGAPGYCETSITASSTSQMIPR